MYRRIGPTVLCALLLGVNLVGGCSNSDSGGGEPPDTSGPPPPLEQSRSFRAVAGVSMGAYGALNLGTKETTLFSTIAALGGPIDMRQLLKDSVDDNLEVKAQTDIPRQVGDDFTYDHLPPYPDRDTRVLMFQDLAIAFGNPFLHHPDPARQYLAIDSEPAMLKTDDQFGEFTTADLVQGFRDGGDRNEDGLRQTGEDAPNLTDVALLAVGSLPMIVSGANSVSVGGRLLADLNADGIFDVGEGLVVNLSEPFTDANENRVYEPDLGETYDDVGLDGVAGSGDFGEGNSRFDYDPDHANWLAEDPLTRVAARTAGEIATQRMYLDVGTRDEFGFAAHYDHFVTVLESKGLAVETHDGFPSNCANLEEPDADFLLVRYEGGHIGVATVDPDDIFNGNVCGENTVWQRIVSMIGFLNASFPDGLFGPGGDFDPLDIDFDLDDLDFDVDVDLPDADLRGATTTVDIASPALAVAGGATPVRRVLVYRPPAFFRTDRTFPVVYFLGGYGQRPEDFERVGLLLDALILSGQLQNMYFVFLPGDGGRMGSFYVNHRIPDSQVPEIDAITSGRYEDSMIEDLIPTVENGILKRRVRS